ncbi:uncharacterized protein PV06_10760 [Exophiala oligosperma]|uniref:Acyl-protein thioesterase 1 n=2 Tax=Chaetothyriales TaxID=34395 RepID=A0A0D2D1F2_9EURO|nr:uncharacterized protein PV06_10760 [Exophiala oligosperma]KAJ9640242.1 hypothetical protein H2204_003467 [Knufia peltigerae]KIW37138.1 hypothetical protein PV06_10760 [Exophiala oligosperma]
MSAKAPYILPPTAVDSSSGRPATLIFLHGYDDEAEGLPLGLAQQFQFYQKMPYLKWILPNADHNHEAMARAWYLPKALPNAMKPRIPGHEEDEEGEPDDEEGIMKSVDIVDKLVEEELKGGTPPERILVGGFSQGCAVSLVWSLVGRLRHDVAGLVCLSGYLPLKDRIQALQQERPAASPEGTDKRRWFYVHGTRDMLVPKRLYLQGKEELSRLVGQDRIEEHLYEGMGHSTNAAELRDLLTFLERVIPA